MLDNNQTTLIDAPWQPLADRMRPQTVAQFFGQTHILSEGKPLRRAIELGKLHSMILWGPSGTGKTTLAKILASTADAELESISAVLAGVKEIRIIVERAKLRHQQSNTATILFVDEVHRFNKSQQDAFLPHVENGTLTLVGATTENPSFSLNNALLSRARVYVLKHLSEDDLCAVMQQAIDDTDRGLGLQSVIIEPALLSQLAIAADGDARKALSLLEMVVELVDSIDKVITIKQQHIEEALSTSVRRFDKGGDIFYDQISALHKSVRGTDPDAALYWLCCMLEGGCDPLYIARRMVRMASEDIGNADPRALQLALNAYETQERLGSPEGELALAQAVLYLASAPKSNACYVAYNAAAQDAKQTGSFDVPIHLRNAPTKLMRELGYGKAYRYPHDEPDAYVPGENYFPEAFAPKRYYQPVQRGLEIRIAEKLERLRQLK